MRVDHVDEKKSGEVNNINSIHLHQEIHDKFIETKNMICNNKFAGKEMNRFIRRHDLITMHYEQLEYCYRALCITTNQTININNRGIQKYKTLIIHINIQNACHTDSQESPTSSVITES